MKALPCPVCKSEDIIVNETDDESMSGWTSVECSDCGFTAWGAEVSEWNEINRVDVDIDLLKSEWFSD